MRSMKGRSGWLFVLVAVVLGGGWWLLRSGQVEVADASAEVRERGDDRAVERLNARHRLDRDVRHEARATIRGRVTDGDGEPIGGARVCALTSTPDLESLITRQPVCSLADAQGYYAVEGLFAVSYRVSASAPRHRPAQWVDGETTTSRRFELRLSAGQTVEGIDLVLDAGGVPVRGVIKDLAGGPIAGAWIRSDGAWWGTQGDDGWSAVASDDEGEFEIWVAPGKVSLRAVADGYTEASKSGVAPGQTFEIFLTPASTLVGKVVMAGTAEPVAGARVTAGGRGFLGRGTVAFTGPDGVFRLEGIDPGTYKAEASTSELFGMAAEAVHLGLAETSEPVVVEVHPAFAVEGAVVIAGSNEPCTDGWVSLESTEKRGGTRSNLDPDGTVVLRALQAGTYQVRVTCEGYVARPEYPTIELADRSVRGVTWEVEPGASLSGIIVHADGTPAEGISVFARPRVGDDPRAKSSFASGKKSEADGTFELEGILPGKYELDASTRDGLQLASKPEVELAEGQHRDDVRLELEATGTLEGIVRDGKGGPVAGATVVVRDQRRTWLNTTTRDDGSFDFDRITVGSIRVQAQTDAWQTMRAPGQTDDDVPGERVTVSPGEVATVELVVEARDGVIRGRVVDADGGPVSDAFVQSQRETDSAVATQGASRRRLSWGSPRQRPVLTDLDGQFELDQLTEGTHVLKAYRQGGGEGVLEGVATGSDVTISLESPGALEGTVSIEGGAPPERFTVTIRDRKVGAHATDTFFRTDGTWRLTNVSEGNYEILVQSADGDGEGEVELGAGETKSGIEIALTGRVDVRGTVVDLETGEPIPGMRVSIGLRGGGLSLGFDSPGGKETTDAQGRYELERVPIGRASAVVLPKGFTNADYEFTWTNIIVPAGEREVELPPIQLVKKRLGEGEASGSLGLKLKESDPGEDAENRRVVVGFVRPGGPAAQAGLEPGDEIVDVDGHDVRGSKSHLFTSLTAAPPGRDITLGLADDRKVSVTLGPPD